MDSAKRGELVAQYKNGYQTVVDALEGITEVELDVRPAPDAWTAREVVHHLADGETTSAIRLRRLLVENHPLIPNYDEEEYARRLFYDRPIATSLEVLRAVRRSTAEIVERLTEDQWQRAGTHSVSGPYTVEGWLEIYAAHAYEHAAQIRRARRVAGQAISRLFGQNL